MMENPSLEDELRNKARKDPDAEDFYARYTAMKAYLSRAYYPWIQVNCPYFTDHGLLHVLSVLQAASQLLGPQVTNKKGSELSTLDLFLVLSSILWHDVGN